jgi:hypothetical protein
LACIGILGPIGATLLSNGSAIIATLNGLRPIMGEHLEPPRKVKVIEQGLMEKDMLENEAAEPSLPVVRKKKARKSRSPRAEMTVIPT